MRRVVGTVSLFLLVAGVMAAGTISLTGSSDTVAFNGTLAGFADTITLGSDTCLVTPGQPPSPAFCTFAGMQPESGGWSLGWQFTTPNTDPSTATFDPFGDLFGPTGGTFSANDGTGTSFGGTYVFSSWNYDGNFYGSDDQYQGIDLNGLITVTSIERPLEIVSLCATSSADGCDPNEAAFLSDLSLPGATSYNFTLDVGNCHSGSGDRVTACIQMADPMSNFISLTLTPNVATPEPATLALSAIGLLAALGARRRIKKGVAAR